MGANSGQVYIGSELPNEFFDDMWQQSKGRHPRLHIAVDQERQASI
jgi:hypothetical protein